MPEMATLVIKRDLLEVLDDKLRNVLEKETLPAYLSKRRWFASAGNRTPKARVLYATPFGDGKLPMLLSEVEVRTGDSIEHYQLPLGFVAEDSGSVLSEQFAMARIRRGREVGLLTDAFTMESFVRTVVQNMRQSSSMIIDRGTIEFSGTEGLTAMEIGDEPEITYLSAEQSNSSVVVNGNMVLKLIRHVHQGIHPELEMGAYLTRQGFEHCAPMLGEVRRVDNTGETHALMVLQGFLNNQGDAWEWTQATLERAIRDQLAGGLSVQENQYTALYELENFSRLLGQRLGEMHVALSAETDDVDFAPEPTSEKDAKGWAKSIRSQVETAIEALGAVQDNLDDEGRDLVKTLKGQQKALLKRIDELAASAVGGLRIRVHGDLHLGQVLVVQGDAYIIDFEGEPSRPLNDRRAKLSPYKDVTGVLRSIDYAVAMALQNAQSTDSSEQADETRAEIARSYRESSSQAFLSAYREAAAQIPHGWSETDGEAAALALFSIEKAAYEIHYETEHRPTWVSVPLRGMVDLVNQLEGTK